MSAELGLADPASLAWALPAADSGAGPPLHRGWARGTTPARDLGRKIGGDTEGEERERETDGRVSPTPWHATIWSSASWMARSSDAGRWHWTLRGRLREPRNKLLQHHLVDDMVDAAFPGQQPSAAGVPELVSHHEGGRSPPAPVNESAGGAARGSGRPAGGWLISGRRRPGGSGLAAAAPPTAPPRLAGG